MKYSSQKPGSALVYVVLIMSVATAVALAAMAAVINDARYARAIESSAQAEAMAQSAIQDAKGYLKAQGDTVVRFDKDQAFGGENCDTLGSSSFDCPHYSFSVFTQQKVTKDYAYDFWTDDFVNGVEKTIDVSGVTGDGLRIEVLLPTSDVSVTCRTDTAPLPLVTLSQGATYCDVKTADTKVYLTANYTAGGAPMNKAPQPLVRISSKAGGSSGADGVGIVSFGGRIQVEAKGISGDGTVERRYSISRYKPGEYESFPGGGTSGTYVYTVKAVTGFMAPDGYCSVLNACR